MENLIKQDYSTYSDFQLANAYFNNLRHNADEKQMESFMIEVDKRRGEMLPSEWLDYHY